MTTGNAADGWSAAVRAELLELAGPPSLEGTVRVDVTGGADGDRSAHARFGGGRLLDLGPGTGVAPDATVTLTSEDARAVLAGDLDPSVAFMQGRMKVAGDMGLVLDLLALAATDAARGCRERIAARTAS